MMPFELQGARATFQRLIWEMNGFASAYLDDLIIYSISCADNVSHLRRVLERLVWAWLTATLSKCQFGKSKCTFLGHVIGSGGMEPELSKVLVVKQFAKTKMQV